MYSSAANRPPYLHQWDIPDSTHLPLAGTRTPTQKRNAK